MNKKCRKNKKMVFIIYLFFVWKMLDFGLYYINEEDYMDFICFGFIRIFNFEDLF